MQMLSNRIWMRIPFGIRIFRSISGMQFKSLQIIIHSNVWNLFSFDVAIYTLQHWLGEKLHRVSMHLHMLPTVDGDYLVSTESFSSGSRNEHSKHCLRRTCMRQLKTTIYNYFGIFNDFISNGKNDERRDELKL